MPAFVSSIRSHPLRFIKTCALYTSFIAVGFSLGVVGPTLLDLRTQVQEDIKQVSISLSTRAGGYALGSVVTGLLFKKVNFLLTSSLCLLASSVLTAVTPHIHGLYVLWSVFFMNGIFLGFFEAASNMIVLHIWGKENQPFMQALHMCFGIGALVAPMIAEPFLFESDSISGHDELECKKCPVNSTLHDPSELRLVYPYSIGSGFMAFNAVFFLILWKLYPVTEEHPSRKKMSNTYDSSNDLVNEKYENSKLDYGIQLSVIAQLSELPPDLEPSVTDKSLEKQIYIYKMLVIGFAMVFMHAFYGLEITFGSFLMTYVVKSSLGLEKSIGAFMTTLFWSTFTFFRLLTVLYINFVGTELNIILSLAVVIISNILLVSLGSSSTISVWITTALIGIGISSLWASLFGYIEEYFVITSRMASFMIVSTILGEFVFPLLISPFIAKTPRIFEWICILCTLLMVVSFTFIVFIVRRKLKPLMRKLEPSLSKD